MLNALANLLAKLMPKFLPRVLTERPDLLADHALAYVSLARSEVESLKAEWMRRALYGALALVFGLSFLMLSGIALMLYAIQQVRTGLEWMLIVVPAVPLFIAVVSVVLSLSKEERQGSSLSAQFQTDLKLVKTLMEPRS